jgi:DNA-binding NarL/FixJ family response regulator
MTDPIRIIIADDHAIFRDGLAALLEEASGIEVLAEVADGNAAIEKASEDAPDVMLMDVMMPDLNGVIATKRILAANASIGIIMLTMLEDDETVFGAMCAGARGYILKGSGKDEVLETIRVVADGGAMFGPDIAGRLTHFFQEGIDADQGPFPDLTPREREVLEHIASGMNNKKIARKLHISPRTVGNHISSIFSKLQVSDRAQAIVKARTAGFGESP